MHDPGPAGQPHSDRGPRDRRPGPREPGSRGGRRQRRRAPPCPPSVFEDTRRLAQGGADRRTFTLARPCRAGFDLRIAHAVGRLQVAVTGPAGEAYRAEREGLCGPGVTVSTGSTTTTARSADLAAGAYTYAFDASNVADFTFRVRAA